ncbi:hypothetical protein ACJ73_06466 [Blastomyces percursus]|uniref:Uncharacterized protein n=1 Tax=Blastomyces percursus TaxID=1658174 RepID=A0A1J9Q0P3_9EURO|nr:hypothetical protein ACJ73_06466 [Blastomyces percursus]
MEVSDDFQFDIDSERVFEDHVQVVDESAPPHEPIILTDSRTTSSLLTYEIEHTILIPEYPTTSSQGYAYIINTRFVDEEEMKKPWQLIQYGKFRIAPPKRTHSAYLRTPVIRHRYQCSGIQRCEYMHEQLVNLSHNKVNAQLWEQLSTLRTTLISVSRLPSIRAAISIYYGIKRRFDSQTSCGQFTLSTCKPVWRTCTHPEIAGVYQPYIACVHYTCGNSDHLFIPVSTTGRADISYLEQLVERELEITGEVCSNFFATSTRRTHCNIDHIQGRGKLVHQKCNVIFDILIPIDLENSPYIALRSHGLHSHPPPPPSRIPVNITRDIAQVIHQMKDPDLTLTLFLKSPEIKTLCQRYSQQTFTQIHKSLINMDRIAALIYKERLFHFPEGRDFAGVMYHYQQDQQEHDPYIQRIYNENNQFMIFCAFKVQLKLLLTLKSFEIDMSFKRIQSRHINEIVLATMLPEDNKIFTLLRVIVNTESTSMYKKLFERFFTLVYDVTGFGLQFHHLHGQGLHAVVMDMDTKQMTGLGQAIAEIDDQHRGWHWQLRNIIIFCHIHFMRGVDRTIGTSSTSSELRRRMCSLLTCTSEEDYMNLCDLLIANESGNVAYWAQHKRNSIIAAGINGNCSLMPVSIYKEIQKHTNAVEQTHNKSLKWGRYGSLLGTVLHGRTLDARDVDQHHILIRYGVFHSNRSNLLSQRYFNSIAREQRKRAREEERVSNDTLLEHSSSSGNIQRQSSQRSQSVQSRGRQYRQSTSRSSSRSSPVHNRLSPAPAISQTSSVSDLRRVASVNLHELQSRQDEITLKSEEMRLRREAAEIEALELKNRRDQLELQKMEQEFLSS